MSRFDHYLAYGSAGSRHVEQTARAKDVDGTQTLFLRKRGLLPWRSWLYNKDFSKTAGY